MVRYGHAALFLSARRYQQTDECQCERAFLLQDQEIHESTCSDLAGKAVLSTCRANSTPMVAPSPYITLKAS